jgi:hypothetical protein
MGSRMAMFTSGTMKKSVKGKGQIDHYNNIKVLYTLKCS